MGQQSPVRLRGSEVVRLDGQRDENAGEEVRTSRSMTFVGELYAGAQLGDRDGRDHHVLVAIDAFGQGCAVLLQRDEDAGIEDQSVGHKGPLKVTASRAVVWQDCVQQPDHVRAVACRHRTDDGDPPPAAGEHDGFPPGAKRANHQVTGRDWTP